MGNLIADIVTKDPTLTETLPIVPHNNGDAPKPKKPRRGSMVIRLKQTKQEEANADN